MPRYNITKNPGADVTAELSKDLSATPIEIAKGGATSSIRFIEGSATKVRNVKSGGSTLYGPELVSNGTFDTDDTGWTDRSANTTSTVAGGQMTITNDPVVEEPSWVSQQIAMVDGLTYFVSVDFYDTSTASGIVHIGTSAGSTSTLPGTNLPSTTTTTYTATVTANSDNPYITIKTNNASVNLETVWDNVSVRRVF